MYGFKVSLWTTDFARVFALGQKHPAKIGEILAFEYAAWMPGLRIFSKVPNFGKLEKMAKHLKMIQVFDALHPTPPVHYP